MNTTARLRYWFALGLAIGGSIGAAIAYLIVSKYGESLLPLLLPYAIVLVASLLFGIAELIEAFGQDFSEGWWSTCSDFRAWNPHAAVAKSLHLQDYRRF